MAVDVRIQPHNDDAEIATLGSILIDPESLDLVSPLLSPEDFYRKANAIIYKTFLSLEKEGMGIDYVTVIEELEKNNMLDTVKGVAYIASLSSRVPSSANIEHYAHIVQEHSVRRQLIMTASKIMNNAYDLTLGLSDLLEESEKKIFAVAEARRSISFHSVQDSLRETMNLLEKRQKGSEQLTGISSGYKDLDDMLSGFQESEFIVIGARPSIGKTALALSMLLKISAQNKISAGFFSLEMSSHALAQRMIASTAQINLQRIRKQLSLKELQNAMNATSRLYEAPLWIADDPSMRLLDLRAQARRMCHKHGVRIIFIDYISLINVAISQSPRHEQIAEISRSLKALARELGIPIVALSQLNRDSEGRRPLLANIRESGSIEQDADVVLFLHRERNDFEAPGGGLQTFDTELIIAKQRNGPIGSIRLVFLAPYTRFELKLPETSSLPRTPSL